MYKIDNLMGTQVLGLAMVIAVACQMCIIRVSIISAKYGNSGND